MPDLAALIDALLVVAQHLSLSLRDLKALACSCTTFRQLLHADPSFQLLWNLSARRELDAGHPVFSLPPASDCRQTLFRFAAS